MTKHTAADEFEDYEEYSTTELPDVPFELVFKNRVTGRQVRVRGMARQLFAHEFAALDDYLIGAFDPADNPADGTGAGLVTDRRIRNTRCIRSLRVKQGEISGPALESYLARKGNDELNIYLWEAWKEAVKPGAYTFRRLSDLDDDMGSAPSDGAQGVGPTPQLPSLSRPASASSEAPSLSTVPAGDEGTSVAGGSA